MAHEYVVNHDESARQILNETLKIKIPVLKSNDIVARRLALGKYIGATVKRDRGLEHLQKLQNIQQIEHISRIQSLERIQSLDYYNIKIDTPQEETLIYCDIPYRGTAEYQHGGFDHKKFDKWFAELPFTAFLSEYDSPHECVLTLRKRVLLNKNDNSTVKDEKLYWNRR